MIFKHYFPIFASTLATLTHTAKSEASPKPAKGKAFDHIFIIFLENTNYALAASDPYLQHLSQTAITLTNYHALTHPSQPNYIASIGGDYYGLNNDLDTTIPANYTTIVDLLEPKHLTWKTYQEDMPDICYTAPQAPGTVDAATGLLSGDGLYFRKHNPFMIHESIAKNATRCRNVVPATQLALDLSAASPPPPFSSSITSPPPPPTTTTTTPLPNYMYFTPNMIHNGHNTTVRDSSLFLSFFLPPLLTSPAFISSNTLVVITFDETDDYTIRDNLIYTLLLGSNDLVIPQALKNTTDNTFYTHYSLLSTVESNWDLGNLGRNDANNKLANVFKVVADKTGYKNFEVASQDIPVFNDTVPGFLTGTPHVRSSPPPPPHTTTPSHASNIHCVSATLLMTIAYLITTIGTLLV